VAVKEVLDHDEARSWVQLFGRGLR
jgi:hypothetical protein